MDLLKQIDELAKRKDFRTFLEDLEAIEADKDSISVRVLVAEKINFLMEARGEGDYDAYRADAMGRGINPDTSDPRVQKALAPKKSGIGIVPQANFAKEVQQGQPVRYDGKVYTIGDYNGKVLTLDDPKATFPGVGGLTLDSSKIDFNFFRPVDTKTGKRGWVYDGKGAEASKAQGPAHQQRGRWQ